MVFKLGIASNTLLLLKDVIVGLFQILQQSFGPKVQSPACLKQWILGSILSPYPGVSIASISSRTPLSGSNSTQQIIPRLRGKHTNTILCNFLSSCKRPTLTGFVQDRRIYLVKQCSEEGGFPQSCLASNHEAKSERLLGRLSWLKIRLNFGNYKLTTFYRIGRHASWPLNSWR